MMDIEVLHFPHFLPGPPPPRNKKKKYIYIYIYIIIVFCYFLSRLYDTAIRLGELQAQFKVQINPEEYARDNLKFGLVEVVYEWAKVVF